MFPSGAQIQFKVCQSDADTKNFDGGSNTLLCASTKLNGLSKQVSYLESRIRSKAKGPHRLVCTCNPCETVFIEVCTTLLRSRYRIPIPELSGKERYYPSVMVTMYLATVRKN